eukprot:CAMPEP_0118664274 /NCGR_PEP_ID=MMETSP0785-20121206/17912_1 /TAXON_ID=91992 /ORGANISM="Bolidomonas pacifica, Strain CCMP 1866" /LENGTH=70 /DNA_ID=CAMNT_0006558143 /DNA_START=717 /DNA_END=925 /DNA_ORIENTATION=-
MPGSVAAYGLGASGGVFGLLGGYYVYLKRNSKYFDKRGVEAGLKSMRATVGINVANGLLNSKIDNYAHLG